MRSLEENETCEKISKNIKKHMQFYKKKTTM